MASRNPGFIRRLHAVFSWSALYSAASVVWLQIVNKISDFRSCPVDKYPIEYNSEFKDRGRLCLQPCPVNVEDERYVQNYRNRPGGTTNSCVAAARGRGGRRHFKFWKAGATPSVVALQRTVSAWSARWPSARLSPTASAPSAPSSVRWVRITGSTSMEKVFAAGNLGHDSPETQEGCRGLRPLRR